MVGECGQRGSLQLGTLDPEVAQQGQQRLRHQSGMGRARLPAPACIGVKKKRYQSIVENRLTRWQGRRSKKGQAYPQAAILWS